MTRGLTRLPRFEPGSPDWHLQRARAVGGSEIAAVMGFSPWESPFSLWHRKKALVGQSIEDRPELYWGRAHEPTIRRWYAEQHPEWRVHRTGTFVVTDRPYQLVSPDADVLKGPGRRVPLEIKTARDDVGWGPSGSDIVPIYYRTQAIWQMDALGADHCHFAALFGGSDPREYTVEYDESEAVLLRAAAAGFVQSLVDDARPKIDSHTATYSVVRELHPDIRPADVEIDEALARRFVQARDAATNAEAEKQYAISLIADVLGDARRATFDGTTIAQRQARGTGLPFLVAGRKLPTFSTKAA